MEAMNFIEAVEEKKKYDTEIYTTDKNQNKIHLKIDRYDRIYFEYFGEKIKFMHYSDIQSTWYK